MKKKPKHLHQAGIERRLKSLRTLRRELCCYVPPMSDKMCDCKYLRMPNEPGDPEPLRGERTGCCEVRQAIGALETILKAMKATPQ